jgi:hypothetical protein
MSDLHAHLTGRNPKPHRSYGQKYVAGIMFRLSDDLHQRVKQRAEAECMTVSTWLRRLMLRELKQKPTI